jgi:hypothetical protein
VEGDQFGLCGGPTDELLLRTGGVDSAASEAGTDDGSTVSFGIGAGGVGGFDVAVD